MVDLLLLLGGELQALLVMIHDQLKGPVGIAFAPRELLEIAQGQFAKFLLAAHDVLGGAVDFLLLVVLVRRGQRVEDLVVLQFRLDQALLLGDESPILNRFHAGSHSSRVARSDLD